MRVQFRIVTHQISWIKEDGYIPRIGEEISYFNREMENEYHGKVRTVVYYPYGDFDSDVPFVYVICH